METENRPERRENIEDLERAKAQLEELLDQLNILFHRDSEINKRGLEIKEDLQKITSAIQLKDKIRKIQEVDSDSNFLERAEDLEKRNEIHRKLAELESQFKN